MIEYEMLPGNAEAYSFQTIQRMPDSPLAGKRVCVLGSSLAAGYASGGEAIAEYISRRFGAFCRKEAVSGTTLAESYPDSYGERLRRLDPQEAFDLFLCQLSTNDARLHCPPGEVAGHEPFDTQTTLGAIDAIIQYVENTWHCPVVFFTSARYESEPYDDLVRRLKELQAVYGFGLIDLWKQAAFNDLPEEKRALYLADHVHPTRAGYRDWWGPEIEKQLLTFWEGGGVKASESGIRNIVFDLGGVLVDFFPERCMETLGFSDAARQSFREKIFGALWASCDRIPYEEEEIRALFKRHVPGFEAEVDRLWDDLSSITYPMPYSMAWLLRLKRRGFRIYILSNYGKCSFAFNEPRYPFLKLADGKLISYEVQKLKPEAEIYRALLMRYGLKAEESVFLDDVPANVEGARKLGFSGIVFHSFSQAAAELEEILAAKPAAQKE